MDDWQREAASVVEFEVAWLSVYMLFSDCFGIMYVSFRFVYILIYDGMQLDVMSWIT